MTGQPRSIVTYRVGGHEYPMTTNRQCKVCVSPYRMDIEEAIVHGRTYQKIIDSLPEGNDLTRRNAQDHYLNGHMPLEVSATRQIVEKRAERIGKRIEDGAEALVDGITLLEVTVQKTFEGIANGSIKPDLADGVRAARILAQLGEYEDAGGVDQQAIIEAFMQYHETAQQVMAPEEFNRFGEMLDRNPVLKALASRFDGEEHEVVQSEAVGAD